MTEEEEQQFQAMQALIGPKRVDTKEVEIEAHDPLKVQQLLERRAAKPVLFSQFGYTKVVPKNGSECCSES